VSGNADALARLVRFYETVAPDTVPQLRALYRADARFKDPFHEVRGHDAIEAIFVHMFRQVGAPRFRVTARVAQGEQAFLVWEFLFRLGRRDMVVRGATHLVFDAEALVALHRDYWDVAEELYEKLPLLGGLMRLLKRAARR
jgi:hypothetical protein